MPELKRIASQCIKGIPYLKKELARRASLSTGKVLATPMTYYVIFSGRCNLACTFCTIYKEVEPILSAEVMFRIVREAKELSGKGFQYFPQWRRTDDLQAALRHPCPRPKARR